MFVLKRLSKVLGSINAFTINSIKYGSVILEGSAAPTGAPGSTKAAEEMKALSDIILEGNLAGIVGDASLTVA